MQNEVPATLLLLKSKLWDVENRDCPESEQEERVKEGCEDGRYLADICYNLLRCRPGESAKSFWSDPHDPPAEALKVEFDYYVDKLEEALEEMHCAVRRINHIEDADSEEFAPFRNAVDNIENNALYGWEALKKSLERIETLSDVNFFLNKFDDLAAAVAETLFLHLAVIDGNTDGDSSDEISDTFTGRNSIFVVLRTRCNIAAILERFKESFASSDSANKRPAADKKE